MKSKPRCGKFALHCYVNGVCNRCGRISSHQPGPQINSAFFQGIETFRQFCRKENLPFRFLLIDATELAMNHWSAADARERREYRKKLVRRDNA